MKGHTSHSELVSFLRRAKSALRDEESLIIVKENTCEDGPGGEAKEFLDEEDSSLTRYVSALVLLSFFPIFGTLLVAFRSFLPPPIIFPVPSLRSTPSRPWGDVFLWRNAQIVTEACADNVDRTANG